MFLFNLLVVMSQGLRPAPERLQNFHKPETPCIGLSLQICQIITALIFNINSKQKNKTNR